MTNFITLTSDFGPGNIGCGAMEAVIFEIAPKARVVHLCHSIRGFDIKEGAKMLEGVARLPKGIHVGVVDPGVGTERRGVLLQTRRGDFLIGPDNGLLRPAADFLGGIEGCFELTNDHYHHKPVSPIFHGRDIFAPVAAHLAGGVSPKEFGPAVDAKSLAPAPYSEGVWQGDTLCCEVIHINENGSVFLNVRAAEFKKILKQGENLEISHFFEPPGARHRVVGFQWVFGEVLPGEPLILEDDFGRMELAVNQGNFSSTFDVKRGDSLVLRRIHE